MAMELVVRLETLEKRVKELEGFASTFAPHRLSYEQLSDDVGEVSMNDLHRRLDRIQTIFAEETRSSIFRNLGNDFGELSLASLNRRQTLTEAMVMHILRLADVPLPNNFRFGGLHNANGGAGYSGDAGYTSGADYATTPETPPETPPEMPSVFHGPLQEPSDESYEVSANPIAIAHLEMEEGAGGTAGEPGTSGSPQEFTEEEASEAVATLKKVYYCEHCSKVFYSEDAFAKHKRTTSHKVFASRKGIKSHRYPTNRGSSGVEDKKQQEVRTESGFFGCDVTGCVMGFRTRKLLETHFFIVHDSKFVCSFKGCERVFGMEDSLKWHERNHRKPKTSQSGDAGRSDSTRTTPKVTVTVVNSLTPTSTSPTASTSASAILNSPVRVRAELAEDCRSARTLPYSGRNTYTFEKFFYQCHRFK